MDFQDKELADYFTYGAPEVIYSVGPQHPLLLDPAPLGFAGCKNLIQSGVFASLGSMGVVAIQQEACRLNSYCAALSLFLAKNPPCWPSRLLQSPPILHRLTPFLRRRAAACK